MWQSGESASTFYKAEGAVAGVIASGNGTQRGRNQGAGL